MKSKESTKPIAGMIPRLVPTVSSSGSRFRWRVFVVTIGVAVAAITAFWVMVPPTYLTNDDVTIKRDLEGLTAPGAAPTGYVLMAHSILGWLLVWIERVIHVHVWDLVVAGLLICSIAMLLACAWSIATTASARVLSVGIALVVITPLLDGLQFTISATLAGVTAMTTAALERLSPSPGRGVLVASGVLLCVGLLVRPMGATAGALVTAGLLLPLAVCHRESRVVHLRRLLMAIAAVALVASLVVYLDDVAYRLSPAWNAYHEDNWMLARLFEWGGDLPPNVAEPLRAQLGWSANDWDLLRRFWGIDPSIHSHSRVEELYRAWSALADWRLRTAWLIQRTTAALTPARFFRLIVESRIALVTAALLAVAYASWRGAAAAVGSAAIFFAACIAIEITFKELPVRLFAPLQVGLVSAVLITCCTLSRPTKLPLTIICAGVAVALTVSETQTVVSRARAERNQSREIDAQVVELLQQQPSLLLLHADSFPSEYWWRPFHTPPVQLRAIQLGMNNHNPYVQLFAAHAYGESLLHAICTDPSILVVAERGRLDPVTTFMKERYGTDVDWREVYAGSFRAWRCSPGHRQ
jgi:hypothetical protein